MKKQEVHDDKQQEIKETNNTTVKELSKGRTKTQREKNNL